MKTCKLFLALLLAALLSFAVAMSLAKAEVGVKKDNWIKYGELSVTGTGYPSNLNYEWSKIEVTDIQGNTVTVTATYHPETGSEATQTLSGDISTGSGTLGFSIIPANMEKGENLPLTGYGTIPITDVVARTYAGVSRNTVYVEYGISGLMSIQLYWDQATGIMVEMHMEATMPTTYSATMKATETNMWSASLLGLLENPIYLAAIVLIVIVVIVMIVIVVRKRKQPPQPTQTAEETPPQEAEG